MFRYLAWGVMLSLLGCGALRHARESDPTADRIQEIDRLFGERLAEERLLESNSVAAELLLEDPNQPDVLWRMARGLEAQAYGHTPEDAVALRLEAMEWGRRCLRRNPGWASRETLAGGRISARAWQRLTTDELPCLEALLVAWIRRVEQRGPSAHIDLEPLQLLAARAMELDDSGWIPPWAMGMALGLEAEAGPGQLEEVEALMRLAAGREPELATPWVDYWSLRRLHGLPPFGRRGYSAGAGHGRSLDFKAKSSGCPCGCLPAPPCGGTGAAPSQRARSLGR